MPSAIDRGFWISWYDLPNENADQHIAWLHDAYIPKMVSKPGVLWAAHFKTVLTAPGSCIQLGSFNCPRESEDQLLAWYADFRLPAVQAAPDFIAARKLLATSGWVKHVIMYEFSSRDGRGRAQAQVERRHPDGIAW